MILAAKVTGSSAYADDDNREATPTQHASRPSDEIIHISGCAKGCAHPGAAALTVVGTERGCGIVHAASARAVPSSHVDPAHIIAEIEHIISQAKEAADA